MKTYQRNFKKIVYGYAQVKAKNITEARDRFDVADCDEFDNNSDYEWEAEIEVKE
jgi:hypothetical protein